MQRLIAPKLAARLNLPDNGRVLVSAGLSVILIVLLAQTAIWLCGFASQLTAEVWLVLVGTPVAFLLTGVPGGSQATNANAKAKALELEEPSTPPASEPPTPVAEPTAQQQLEQCALAGDCDATEALLKRLAADGDAREVDVSCYNLCLGAFSEAAEVEKATNLMRLMMVSGLQPNEDSYTTVLEGCARIGNGAMAEGWLARMREAGFAPSTRACGYVVGAWAREGEVERAACAFTEFQQEGVAPDAASYGAMLAAYAKQGDGAMAEEWFERMVWDSVAPDVTTYGSVIGAWARDGNVAKADEWWAKLEDSGMKLDARVFEGVAAAYGAGDAHAAEMWLERMRKADAAAV